MEQLSEFADRFSTQAPACDYWTLRLVEEESDHLEVRQGVVEPSALDSSLGAMVTVVKGGGIGYGATSDLSPAGLRAAGARAAEWALRPRPAGPVRCRSLSARQYAGRLPILRPGVLGLHVGGG